MWQSWQKAVADADIIIFYCSLLNKYKFLKNRNGKLGTEESLDLPEDENALLSILLGIL